MVQHELQSLKSVPVNIFVAMKKCKKIYLMTCNSKQNNSMFGDYEAKYIPEHV